MPLRVESIFYAEALTDFIFLNPDKTLQMPKISRAKLEGISPKISQKNNNVVLLCVCEYF